VHPFGRLQDRWRFDRRSEAACRGTCADSNANAHANAGPNSDTHSYSYSYSDADAYFDPDPYSDPDPYTYAKCNSAGGSILPSP